MVRFAAYVAPLKTSGLLLREMAPLAYGHEGREDFRWGRQTLPDPTLDPFQDAESLEALEDEIATLAAHIHAATHRLLTLIAEFDHRRGWEQGGHRSCAHWLSFRTGIDLGAAREKVRTARVLKNLPQTSASMARGELSFSQLRALSRVATASNEGELLELARGCTTAQLERMVRAFRRGSTEDEATLEERRHQMRSLSVFPDEEGMYVVKGRLPAEVGALLMRAVEAASDALYREERSLKPVVQDVRSEATEAKAPGDEGGWPSEMEGESETVAAQRRADALGLLAERALAVGFGHGSKGGGEAGGAPAPISGTRAERFLVMLHVEAETLLDGAEEGERSGEGTGKALGGSQGGGRSELEDGTRVSAETSRRLSCDAGLVRIGHGLDGSVQGAGRRTRTVPPSLRRALEARDQGCRFPGCGLRFTDGHHVRHWADGGETTLKNLVLLCRFHHRLVHEGGWQVGWWGVGHPVFFDLRGGTHFEGRWPGREEGEASTSRREPKAGGLGDTHGAGDRADPEKTLDPVTALTEENYRQGVRPHARTTGARWKTEADIPDQTYFRALEALSEGLP